MKSFVFGTSAWGMAIPAFTFGGGVSKGDEVSNGYVAHKSRSQAKSFKSSQGPSVLILGGVHGNEYEGVVAAYGLLKSFHQQFEFKLRVTVVPEFNPDGVLTRSRHNGHGVDLNRNLPTKDWTPEILDPKYVPGLHPCSEPENKALVQWLKHEKPGFIISLHSWQPCINVNGDCRAEAEAIGSATGYKVVDDIGYPTPGSLGTYAGLENAMPTLTYEIERGSSAPDILRLHVPACLEALKVFEMRMK